MSPEQKSGKEVTTRSDIYSLGLVLYEMFTGKPRSTGRGSSPSELVKDLDPAIERVILRCLEDDPKRRPSSALNVAMALPGGDPVQAALEAGETPSPEMVAASGPTEGLRPRTAVTLAAGIAVGLLALVLLTPKVRMLSQLPLEYPPEVLAEKARDIARSLGYTERAAESVRGLAYNGDHVGYLKTKISGGEAWRKTLLNPPSPVSFWYRQSRVPMIATSEVGPPITTPNNPPVSLPGMISVTLDLDGSLRRFRAIPDPLDAPAGDPSWTSLFAAARLDPSQFAKADPQVPLPLGADTRAAWTGPYRGRADLPVRIEAAAAHGKPAYFEVVWPWTQNRPAQPFFLNLGIVVVVSFVASCLVARHNLRTGRGDTRGAVRLLVFFTFAALATVGLTTNFAGLGNIGGLLWTAMGDALVLALGYLALEPWARRQWPQAMVTWSRVLEGRWRDPAVWRDVLLGLACAIVAGLLLLLRGYIAIGLGEAPSWFPLGGGFQIFPDVTHARIVFADVFSSMRLGVLYPLFYFWIVVLAWMLVRKRLFALIAVFPLVLVTQSGPANHWVDWVFNVALAAAVVLVLERLGLFVSMVYLATFGVIAHNLLTSDLTAWYGLGSMVSVALLAVATLVAFRMSLGRNDMFESKSG
jgi:serine/threonine-protein kinase